MRKLLPVLLSLAAFMGGAAGGEMLRRPAAPVEAAAGAPEQGHDATAASPDTAKGGAEHAELPASAQDSPQADHAAPAGHGGTGAEGGTAGGHGASGDVPAIAWFEFPQQFLVPVLHDGRLDSTMILSLSLEMPGTARETVHAHEIKLRDALLRQLLIHANTGGFDGNFTSEAHLRKLRADLTAVAQGVIPGITAVLIGDIGRQER
ncbi:hypothetical protein CK240_00835 [Paracoccus salipaludis]|uniref:Flagellar basal body-associated protein FliL n=1 Tax=Paracoccus salipaludis TaxID=2032623 RepID=A0A2A2GPZ9_9RHOB|nr:hypothetical protein CK240_00835 [Paracoccus salipaludis]